MTVPEDQNPNPDHHTIMLKYNVRWMTRTFNTRAKVETLLGPEQAVGNISTHDFEAAMKVLPGYQRYYGLLLSSLTLAGVYLIRKPWWSQTRTLGIAAGSAFGSMAFGNALTLKSHFDFVRSLDNPAGFANALEHIQQQTGLPQAVGPVIARKVPVDNGSYGNADDVQGHVAIEPALAETVEQASQPAQNTQGEQSRSRWDQIRSANAGASRVSSWDTIRQRQERSQIQKSTPSSGPTNQPPDDRAVDQARFDALLERERNLGVQEELRE